MDSHKLVGGKVAPGMSVVFEVSFAAPSADDQHGVVMCVTERETFQVPIHAVGEQPHVEFIDGLDFGTVPLLAPHTRTFVMRNPCEHRSVDFSFDLVSPIDRTPSPSYHVSPQSGRLEPNQLQQVTVTLEPIAAGPIDARLLLRSSWSDHSTPDDNLFEEKQQIDAYADQIIEASATLTGIGSCLSVSLSQDRVTLPPTFISLSSTRTTTLSNTSNTPVCVRDCVRLLHSPRFRCTASIRMAMLS